MITRLRDKSIRSPNGIVEAQCGEDQKRLSAFEPDGRNFTIFGQALSPHQPSLVRGTSPAKPYLHSNGLRTEPVNEDTAFGWLDRFFPKGAKRSIQVSLQSVCTRSGAKPVQKVFPLTNQSIQPSQTGCRPAAPRQPLAFVSAHLHPLLLIKGDHKCYGLFCHKSCRRIRIFSCSL